MTVLRLLALCLLLPALAACQKNDLAEPPVPLGDFGLGLNIVVTEKVQKVPVISRNATPAEWELAVRTAIDDRFGRYEGTKLYNLGISVDAYALAPPGIPIVLSPKSALVVTANIWDDAAGKKLNPEGVRLIITENLTPQSAIGSGLTQSRERQIEILSYNAAKRVEEWLLENPEWFGLPPLPPTDAIPISGTVLPEEAVAVEVLPVDAPPTDALPADLPPVETVPTDILPSPLY